MTNKAWQSDIEDLIKYLGKYIGEGEDSYDPGLDQDPGMWIREGIEAFESINGVSVCVMPALGVSDEAPAEEEGDGMIKRGDTVEVRDLEGNTTVVAASEVLQVERVLGNDGSMHERVQVEDGGIVWYSAEHYQLIRV